MSVKWLFVVGMIAACNAQPPATEVRADNATVAPAAPLRPIGVLAQVALDDLAGKTAQEIEDYLKPILIDDAVSGLFVGMHWKDVSIANPSQPSQTVPWDWAALDAIFSTVDDLDRHELAKNPKTITLSIAAGFYTPDWVLAKIPYSCDYLFCGGAAPPQACGKVTFPNYAEMHPKGPTVLPLPWNGTYQSEWKKLLIAVHGRYQSYGELVGINMAGPTGASPEFILPATTTTDPNSDNYYGECGYSAAAMWAALLAPVSPNGVASDDIFVSLWASTVEVYDGIFSGITLIMSPDNGDAMPSYPLVDYAKTSLYGTGCVASMGQSVNDSCAAVSTIVDTAARRSSSTNGFGTQVGGLTASTPVSFSDGDLGMDGVRLLASSAYGYRVGGGEFDHALTDPSNPPKYLCQMAGVPYPCQTMTPELAMYNVFDDYFHGTPGADTFPPQSNEGPARLDYVMVQAIDVVYAQNNTNICVTTPIGNVTAHYLLELANWRLSAPTMGNAAVQPPLPVNPCPQ